LKGKAGTFLLDLLTAVLAAILLSLPDFSGNFWPAGFIAILPLLLRVHNRSYVAIFFIPFFAFFIYLTYVMMWIHQYGWQWLFLVNLMNSVTYALAFLIYFFIRRKLKTDICFIVLPILFVLAEYGKSLGFLAFPWPCLSHGQYANLHFIQISEFTGAWGVTFFLIWFNTALFGFITSPVKRKTLLASLPMLIVLVLNIIYGSFILSNPLPKGTVQVSIFQRDVSTQEEWTPFANEIAWFDYRGLTIEEWTQNLDSRPGGFMVWPEGAIPDALDELPPGKEIPSRKEQIANLATEMGKTFIVGTQFEDERGPYNSAAVFGPDGSLLGLYKKVHIVPFGEVIPLEPYIKSWFPEYPWGSQSLVDGRITGGIDTPEGRVGIVICYESFFPDQTRRTVNDGCDFLFLLTNTSWFGRSKASYQHAHYDVFRAVENRIWLSRAATTGVSSFIDPYGWRYDETSLYHKAARTRLITPRLKETLYTRWGDWFPRLCLLASLIILTVAVYRRNE
jgi:apolipoprotein N-acyltransferase